MSESELVSGLRAGSEDAFDRLIKVHGGRMLSVAKRFLRNEDDARDAVQDAFISIFRSVGKFEGSSQLATWIHRIAVNAALMKLRSLNRHGQEESIEPLLPQFRADGHQIESSVPWRGADEALQDEELRRIVREAVEKLPESYRVVLLLRDIEELTPEETAESLGISRTAVKVRLHRGRQALRTMLDPHLRKKP
ncbi:MAG TPA: sigma-70 family RNA polymerase sigma factor [Thermoanaerobaculia bacterium]|nr:sigma-70 family RNA polymerase sigma factor [Thermoanaerobaculia bacterium]